MQRIFSFIHFFGVSVSGFCFHHVLCCTYICRPKATHHPPPTLPPNCRPATIPGTCSICEFREDGGLDCEFATFIVFKTLSNSLAFFFFLLLLSILLLSMQLQFQFYFTRNLSALCVGEKKSKKKNIYRREWGRGINSGPIIWKLPFYTHTYTGRVQKKESKKARKLKTK